MSLWWITGRCTSHLKFLGSKASSAVRCLASRVPGKSTQYSSALSLALAQSNSFTRDFNSLRDRMSAAPEILAASFLLTNTPSLGLYTACATVTSTVSSVPFTACLTLCIALAILLSTPLEAASSAMSANFRVATPKKSSRRTSCSTCLSIAADCTSSKPLTSGSEIARTVAPSSPIRVDF